jgi:formyltetrahydrofolate synthetase
MSTWDGNNFYYSGQGVVLIGDRDENTGKPIGLIPVGNVSDLKITIATTVIEHQESQTGQRGIDLRLTTQVKAALSMTMENFNAKNLATALRGTATAIAAGSVTAEAVQGHRGQVLPLEHMKVSTVVVHQASTALTAWVDDATPWDYKVNADAGSIELNGDSTSFAGLVASTDTTLLSLTVDYAYAAQNEVDALTSGMVNKYLRFEGLNTADTNAPVVVEVFKFSVDPLKEMAMISDTIQQFVLEGNVLADPLRTSGSKYFRERTLR